MENLKDWPNILPTNAELFVADLKCTSKPIEYNVPSKNYNTLLQQQNFNQTIPVFVLQQLQCLATPKKK